MPPPSVLPSVGAGAGVHNAEVSTKGPWAQRHPGGAGVRSGTGTQGRFDPTRVQLLLDESVRVSLPPLRTSFRDPSMFATFWPVTAEALPSLNFGGNGGRGRL